MATLAECIRRFEAAQAARPPERQVNVIRVVTLSARTWRVAAVRRHPEFKGVRPVQGSEADRCRQAAATSEHLGVPVGLVVESTERVS